MSVKKSDKILSQDAKRLVIETKRVWSRSCNQILIMVYVDFLLCMDWGKSKNNFNLCPKFLISKIIEYIYTIISAWEKSSTIK